MLAAAAYRIGLGLTRTPDPVKPDPDRTRSTRPRWCQLTPDPKPVWWRVTGEGRQLCAMLAEGLKKKILLSSWQCRRIPAEQGAGDSAFCRTPFWVACHVLGCVWVCVDAGFCSAYP